MNCSGVFSLPTSGRCPSAHRSPRSSSLMTPRLFPECQRHIPHRPLNARRTSRPAFAEAGDSRLGAGATSRPEGRSVGSTETNGTAPGTSDASSTAAHESRARAASTDPSTNCGPSSSTTTTTLARSSFRSILKQNYIGEMLFVVIGSALSGALAYWTVGTPLRRFNPYTFFIMMPQATGVHLGTPLRMKGVAMGSVLTATPMLDRVKVEVEVNEAKTIIPRNSKFELTQSGMIPVPSVDIVPPEDVSAETMASIVARAAAGRARSGDAAGDGAAALAASSTGSTRVRRSPKVHLADPKDVAACRLQGVLVCQGDVLDGVQGGSMDELMGHMLKSLRQGESEAAPGTGIVPGRGPLQG